MDVATDVMPTNFNTDGEAFLYKVVRRLIDDLFVKLKDIIAVVFLPLYFTFSGLRTNFGLLNTGEAWGAFAVILIVQFVSKLVGSGISARILGGLNNKEALCFGILMQTKGLVALITFNLGLDYGVISTKFFTINVLMVLVSTLLTSPLVEWIYPMKKMREASLLSQGKFDNIFSVMVCCSSPRNARSLVTIAEHLISANKRAQDYSARVTALNVIEDAGEPANYLWSWFNSKKGTWNPTLRAARDRAKAIGYKVEAIPHYAGNGKIGEELCSLIKALNANLVLMGSRIYEDTVLAAEQSPIKNTVINQVLNGVPCDVAVLIDKKTLGKRARKILCPISGSKADDVALKYCRKMSKASGIEILLLNIKNPLNTSSTAIEEENKLLSICTDNSSMKVMVLNIREF